MTWLPSGFGYNVPTVFWIQTTLIEVAIVVTLWWLIRTLDPIIEKRDQILDWLGETEADKELKRVRGNG